MELGLYFIIKLFVKQLFGGKYGQAGRHVNLMMEGQPAVGETQRIHQGWREIEYATRRLKRGKRFAIFKRKVVKAFQLVTLVSYIKAHF